MYMGTGGSIPFMAMLSEKFPGVQFVVTGVLGPQSNAHGPNEFLGYRDRERRVTGCVAHVVAAHRAEDGELVIGDWRLVKDEMSVSARQR